MSNNTSQQWQFGVDRGGTFTDIVAIAPDGTLSTFKVLSDNPEQYRDAAVHGFKSLLGVREVPQGKIATVKMGTTVATNALLERKGDATVLLITCGFADLLRIGYQNRPKLFDLDIRLPELLYREVIEASERIGADGKVLQPLDVAAVRASLQQAYDRGIRAVAIVFFHGYQFSAHEEQAAEVACDIGFTQISTSHRTSPLIKLISRGDTTVVDAYLSPVLRRYVQQVSDELGASKKGTDNAACARLMFMQSHGGLTDANLFQGKDAILSGPAGGVVGMVLTAKAAGYNRLIGFDMGGTSTDVCHYGGHFERSLETEVAGVRVRAPMMHIHTVAAGGGSILHFRQGRMQVGPESAGANPGPACYRRGGPLTVTDCNVLLGKVQPKFFPHVFGGNADQPIDAEVVQVKFHELSAQIAVETGGVAKSSEELAEGFLRIAVENMANAIKKISVQRGYDVTEYVLNCFGGAGGQHACLVADALGMKTIFVHPYAGVLSAFGMGMADIRSLREQQFAQPLAELEAAEVVWKGLDQAAQDEVAAQGVSATDIRLERTAHIRTQGAHQSLEVPFGDPEAMTKAFEVTHQQRYGYVSHGGELLLDVLSSEAVGIVAQQFPKIPRASARRDALIKRVEMCSGGKTQQVAVYDRAHVQLGEVIQGPAIIIEATGTNIIELGWQAELDSAQNLIIQRYLPRTKTEVVGTDADPIMLEVFNNLFMSIAEQMGAVLRNTSVSTNIKERLDYSCAVFDAEGGLIANAPHIPVHLGAMQETVRAVR
ncbi:MAG: hydantoinase B/oxoprolinase family protein, partial [Alphaproteobacteria bacterium]|nr:hydantoinase B/oxoprolinase family protein [Alphaproteobacteria bacterium]